jgi:hypothetical protein
MRSRAIIVSAKVAGSEYGRESTLSLTLDVKLRSCQHPSKSSR